MRKLFNIILGTTVISVAVSCVKEQSNEELVKVQKAFVAHVDEDASAEVKTTLDEDLSIRWSASDHITVFSGEGKGTSFTDVTVDESGKIATFRGTVDLADAYYAIYPKQTDAVYTSDGETVTAVLPSVQTPADGSFADGMNLSLAKSYGDELHFKNVGALLAVKCPTNYASSVKLVSRDPAVKMSGKAEISYNGGNPVAVASDEAVNYVQMNGISGRYEQTFYFVVYPGNYSKGFDLIFLNNDSTNASIISSTKGLDLKRNSNVLLYAGSFAGWNAPVAPTQITTSSAVENGKAGMKVTWTSTKSQASLYDGYKVYVRPSDSVNEPELKGSTITTSLFVDGLVSGSSYDFGVQTVGKDGKKDSDIAWLENVKYERPAGLPELYSYEEGRGVPELADMTLCYGGNPNRTPQLWDKDRWKAHVVYTDAGGKDYWLFDSFLVLEFNTVHEGKEYIYDIANTSVFSAGKAQWIQQLDYWFDSTYGFASLNECIDDALDSAGPYPRKRYVVFSLPDPIYFQQFADKNSSTVYWGEIDGVQMDFSKVEHRQKAYIWMADQVRARFAQKNYSHIELAGFYILQETLSETYNPQYKKFKEVISSLAEHCLLCNEGLYWVPYGYSDSDSGHNSAIKNWRDYGFTATVLQPNKYWDTWRDWGTICQSYIMDNGLGMEFEFEGSHGDGGWSGPQPYTNASILETVMTSYDADGQPYGSPNIRAQRNKDRFREYMAKCKEYGIYGERMLVLYSGTNGMKELASSAVAKDKEFYHEMCRFFLNNPRKLTEGPEDTPVEKLTAPADVFVEQNDETSVIMSWKDENTSESGFRVYKCTNGDMSSPATADKGADADSYQFNWLVAGNSYTFGVQARGQVEGSHSDVVYAPAYKVLSWAELQSFNADRYQGTDTFTGTYRECGAPQNPSWKQDSNTSGTLTWTCWSSAETGFNIYVRKSTETAWTKAHLKTTAGIDATSAQVTGLEQGGTYVFGVQTAGKTMARNSNIITVGTYTLEVKESAKVTVGAIDSKYAYIAVDYSATGLNGANPEKGLWISTSSADPYASTDGVKLKGPDFLSGSTSVKQLIPASRLNPSIRYYMRAYVWDASVSKYVYSDVSQIQLGAQPDPISLSWTKQSYPNLPSSVQVYKTTSSVNGRNFNAWYAIADPKEVDFRVLYPETVGTKKTVSAQATDDCYVLINGAIFGNYNIGVIMTEGKMTQQWHGEIEGCYWGTDAKLYNVTRAMIGVDADGNPGAYWVGTPWQNQFYYYTSPMTTVVGQAKYAAASSTYPYPAVSWNPYYAVSCGPMLVYDGKVMVDHAKAGSHYMTNYECWDESGIYYGNPDRTAVGITEDGKIVLFICDGRIDASKGAYLTELAGIMKGLGCRYAMNLDGGGSTGMWVKGSGMINYMDGSWRAVKSTLGFFKKK